MKQLIQSIKKGELTIAEVPAPKVKPGAVLVRTRASLVSSGTERMVVDFSEKNLLQKARSRPDLVRQTIDKARREGLLTTLDAVRHRLDQPMSLGYSCAGEVIEVGQGITRFKIGDRVACAGEGAAHAELASVPQNLVVPLPDNVEYEAAAFTTLGAIALQGIRLAETRLGEVVGVIGLGLLGQLTIQMLKAAGCLVVGIDLLQSRADLALGSGADAALTSSDDFTTACHHFSGGHGADAILITADTKSNTPLELAGEAVRDKGTVVAVGAVGMTIPRKIYFQKELDFRISRSYGPGRYDFKYETEGHDYPYGYVRWTEGRNLGAFVQLLAEKKVGIGALITHRFPVDEAAKAYELITGKTSEPFLGVLLTYGDGANLSRKIMLRDSATEFAPEHRQSNYGAPLDEVRLGVIGGGNFANATLLPAIKKLQAIKPIGMASGSGLSARSTADRFGFKYCTTESGKLLNDSSINTVAILTRHHLHAQQTIAALENGKHVFVEKPLCLTEEELASVITAYRKVSKSTGAELTRTASVADAKNAPLLMVGFNRRFAPHIVELKKHLARLQEPLMLSYRANAGYIPPDHWTQDPTQGGGRLRGEGCHFIDLLIFLAGSIPYRVTTRALPDSGRYTQDNFQVMLEFVNGTIGNITYTANGDKSFPKEFLEVFGGGVAARLDDYRTLTLRSGATRINRTARLRQDKGHRGEWQAIAEYLKGNGTIPILFDEIVVSTRATLAAYRSLITGEPVIIEEN